MPKRKGQPAGKAAPAATARGFLSRLMLDAHSWTDALIEQNLGAPDLPGLWATERVLEVEQQPDVREALIASRKQRLEV